MKCIEKLAKHFNINDVSHQRNDLIFITVEKNDLVSILVHLRDIEGFTYLSFLTAVDHLEKDIIQLTYMLNNLSLNFSIGVRVMLERDRPVMETIHHLWEAGKTYQRELHEMFGIDFPGSPDLEKPFILEGWDNMPPMRRDFDTKKYSEETYFPRPGRKTYDPATYMKEKLYNKAEKWEDKK